MNFVVKIHLIDEYDFRSNLSHSLGMQNFGMKIQTYQGYCQHHDHVALWWALKEVRNATPTVASLGFSSRL